MASRVGGAGRAANVLPARSPDADSASHSAWTIRSSGVRSPWYQRTLSNRSVTTSTRSGRSTRAAMSAQSASAWSRSRSPRHRGCREDHSRRCRRWSRGEALDSVAVRRARRCRPSRWSCAGTRTSDSSTAGKLSRSSSKGKSPTTSTIAATQATRAGARTHPANITSPRASVGAASHQYRVARGHSGGVRRLSLRPRAPGALRRRHRAGNRSCDRQHLSWLETNQLPDGTWTYRYRPSTDQSLGGYNWVRHAGTLLSLYQAANAAGTGCAGDRRPGPRRSCSPSGWCTPPRTGGHGPRRRRRPHHRRDRVAAAALAERRDATGTTQDDELLRSLGRYLCTNGGAERRGARLRRSRWCAGARIAFALHDWRGVLRAGQAAPGLPRRRVGRGGTADRRLRRPRPGRRRGLRAGCFGPLGRLCLRRPAPVA